MVGRAARHDRVLKLLWSRTDGHIGGATAAFTANSADLQIPSVGSGRSDKAFVRQVLIGMSSRSRRKTLSVMREARRTGIQTSGQQLSMIFASQTSMRAVLAPSSAPTRTSLGKCVTMKTRATPSSAAPTTPRTPKPPRALVDEQRSREREGSYCMVRRKRWVARRSDQEMCRAGDIRTLAHPLVCDQLRDTQGQTGSQDGTQREPAWINIAPVPGQHKPGGGDDHPQHQRADLRPVDHHVVEEATPAGEIVDCMKEGPVHLIDSPSVLTPCRARRALRFILRLRYDRRGASDDLRTLWGVAHRAGPDVSRARRPT